MNNVNNSPTIYIDGYDLSSPTEVTTAATMRNDNQHQLKMSTINTASKTPTTINNDLLTISSNHNNNNSNPTHEIYSRLSRSFTARGVTFRDPPEGIRLMSF